MVAWTKLVAGREIKFFDTRGEFDSDGSNMRLDIKRLLMLLPLISISCSTVLFSFIDDNEKWYDISNQI